MQLHVGEISYRNNFGTLGTFASAWGTQDEDDIVLAFSRHTA